MKRYWIRVYPDPNEPGVWLAEVPSVYGVRSDGDSREEAIRNAQEALEAMLQALKAKGLPLPEPEEEWIEVEVDAA
ncbi:type II toxin-antitoxin system HicB family antitoxin [Thermus albus]|uniref:type II toxin-antitoxin system HicB family antitoxin n=1 Tax=Thermus albus TaxID=2908146 RepID=UPI001FA9C5F3|nr:type II toxin-antitoxin system HicB family antitoxin [Thermus albus]